MSNLKSGRPFKEIDKKTFEKFCSMMCTKVEIANFFECDEDTVNNWCKRNYGATFSEVWKIHSVKGKMSLRRAQMQSAIDDKNVTMLIWLGKQYLEQSDKQEVQNNNNNYDFSNLSKEDIKELLGKEGE